MFPHVAQVAVFPHAAKVGMKVFMSAPSSRPPSKDRAFTHPKQACEISAHD
jgi:hypothetical protein